MADYKISYNIEVTANVKAAKSWYKNQQTGLEKKFAASIKAAISHLQDNPVAYIIRYRNIRIIHPDNFPFNIHFYLDKPAGKIVITNIIHNR